MEVPAIVAGVRTALPESNTPNLRLVTEEPMAENQLVQGGPIRGRKKHKCSVCGNIARSRCPFHACKSCCVKARNPCFIHVLKTTQPPGGNSQAVSSLAGQGIEQTAVVTSMHFGQASGQGLQQRSVRSHASSSSGQQMHDSLRVRNTKSSYQITRKDLSLVNAWRFQKLREHAEGKHAAEDEAFDRYLQNVSQLEQVFSMNAETLKGLSQEGHVLVDSGRVTKEGDSGVDAAMMSVALKSRLRMNMKRREAHKSKLRRIIDRSFQKLQRGEREDSYLENMFLSFLGGRREMNRIRVQSTEGRERLRRMDLFNALFGKAKQTDSQLDLSSCLKMYEEKFISRQSEADQDKNCNDILYLCVTDDVKTPGTACVGEPSSATTLVCNTSRLDSRGILKGWWKADINEESLVLLNGWMVASDADVCSL